jgi:hypothetical protein
VQPGSTVDYLPVTCLYLWVVLQAAVTRLLSDNHGIALISVRWTKGSSVAMAPLRKRDRESGQKGRPMIEVNMSTSPLSLSSDNIEMPPVTHPVYGHYRPVSHNFSRPHTGHYSTASSTTLQTESPSTPNMSTVNLPPFAPMALPSTGPPSYNSSPIPTRASSPYPGAQTPFVSTSAPPPNI